MSPKIQYGDDHRIELEKKTNSRTTQEEKYDLQKSEKSKFSFDGEDQTPTSVHT